MRRHIYLGLWATWKIVEVNLYTAGLLYFLLLWSVFQMTEGDWPAGVTLEALKQSFTTTLSPLYLVVFCLFGMGFFILGGTPWRVVERGVEVQRASGSVVKS